MIFEDKNMGFGITGFLALIYMVLIALTVFAFVKKKTVLGIVLIVLMVLGIVALGVLWFTSPM